MTIGDVTVSIAIKHPLYVSDNTNINELFVSSKYGSWRATFSWVTMRPDSRGFPWTCNLYLPFRHDSNGNRTEWGPIGHLQDPVTWYGINYTGTQMTQWDFQNKGTLTSPARLSFVLKVPLRHLRPSVIYSVPCDRILQMAYSVCSYEW